MVNSDRYQDLLALRSLPLDTKILYAQEKIREAYEHFNGLLYVSWSGGKDSRVLLHLVKGLFPDVPAVYCDTGLEYPEVRAWALVHADEVLKPRMTFKAVIEKYGYPVHSKRVAQYIHEAKTVTGRNSATRRLRLTGIRPNGVKSSLSMILKRWQYLLNAPFKISHKCCDVFKKQPFADYGKSTSRVPFVGTLTVESLDREYSWLEYGCNRYNGKHPQSRPLSIFTESDILEYHLRFNIPLPSVYGDILQGENGYYCSGLTRTGCVFCAFGCHLEQRKTGFNRFQRLYSSHPVLWRYCMDFLGMREVLRWYGVEIYPDRQQSFFGAVN